MNQPMIFHFLFFHCRLRAAGTMGHTQKYAARATILAYASEILTLVLGPRGIIFNGVASRDIVSIKLALSLKLRFKKHVQILCVRFKKLFYAFY
jgi:hypothetical protein